MAKFWAVLLVSVLIHGCGAGSDDREPVRNSIENGPILSQNPPLGFSLASSGCQSETAAVTLTDALITGWEGFQVTQRRVNLNLTTKESLSGRLIRSTRWGDDFVRQCDWQRSGRTTTTCIGADGRKSDWLATKPRRPLRVCATEELPRQSVEAVAVTAAHALESSWQKATEQLLTLKATTPLELMVLPEFRSIYNGTPPETEGGPTRRVVWTVNNLAYIPSASAPTIAVYPPSFARAQSSPGWLWESQFAMAHELAHHIEFGRHEIAAASAPSVAFTEWDPDLHRKIRVSDPDRREITGVGGANGPAVDEFDDAVSEAFADLSAWYIVGADDRSLRGLDCIGWNRSLANASFKDGTAKILTTEVVETLTIREMPRGFDEPRSLRNNVASCEVPRFTSFHTVGAVLAHGLDQVWTTALRHDQSSPAIQPISPDERLAQRHRIAWAWIQTWRKSWKTEKPNSSHELLERFTVSVEQALETAAQDGLDAAAACKTWKEYFPATPRPAFADAC